MPHLTNKFKPFFFKSRVTLKFWFYQLTKVVSNGNIYFDLIMNQIMRNKKCNQTVNLSQTDSVIPSSSSLID